MDSVFLAAYTAMHAQAADPAQAPRFQALRAELRPVLAELLGWPTDRASLRRLQRQARKAHRQGRE
jgi:hypothetical protein